jgi:hypothetical protein
MLVVCIVYNHLSAQSYMSTNPYQCYIMRIGNKILGLSELSGLLFFFYLGGYQSSNAWSLTYVTMQGTRISIHSINY